MISYTADGRRSYFLDSITHGLYEKKFLPKILRLKSSLPSTLTESSSKSLALIQEKVGDATESIETIARKYISMRSHAIQLQDLRNLNSSSQSYIEDQAMISYFLCGHHLKLLNRVLTEKLRTALNPNCNLFISEKAITASQVVYGHFIQVTLNTPQAPIHITVVCMYSQFSGKYRKQMN